MCNSNIMTRKILFTNIHDTLIHGREAPPGDLILKGDDGNQWISKEALTELSRFREEGGLVYLVSGTRRRNYDGIAGAIPHDGALLEHGGLILEVGYDLDKDWEATLGLANVNNSLGDAERSFKMSGYKIDSDGRVASFRLYRERDEGRRLPDYMKSAVEASLENNPDIRAVRNQDMMDIIPSLSGKANAIKHVLDGIDEPYMVFCFGDDRSDIEMFKLGFNNLTISSADVCAIGEVGLSKGYVSKLNHHEGTLDVLTEINSI